MVVCFSYVILPVRLLRFLIKASIAYKEKTIVNAILSVVYLLSSSSIL